MRLTWEDDRLVRVLVFKGSVATHLQHISKTATATGRRIESRRVR